MKQSKTNQVLGILLIGTFLAFLNQTLMNVALPSIMQDFKITPSTGQWLTNGYLLINGIMVPATAFLIDRFKTRHLYMTMMSIFTVGTLICAIAPNFIILIAGRMIQAVGAGVIGPLLTVTVMRLFAIEHRGRAMGYIGLAMNFAPAIGPTLSGWVVQTYNWRFLFYLLLPFMIISIILAYVALPNIGEVKDIKLHIPSIVLSTLGLGALLLGFSNAGIHDWLSFDVLGYIGIGLVIIVSFILLQLHLTDPILTIKVFSYRKFSFSTMANFFMIMGLYGGMLLLPLYLQNVRQVSPLTSGLILLPGAIMMAGLSPITGNLYDKYGYKRLSIAGLSLLILGTFPFAFIGLTTPLSLIVLLQTIRSIGLAMVLMPIQTEAMNALPLELVSHGNAMFNTIRQVAGSIGTATLITIMSKSSVNFAKQNADKTGLLADIHGIHMAYIVTTFLTILALLLILTMDNRRRNVDVLVKIEEAEGMA